MALWDKYQYAPGMTFGSKMSAHREVIRQQKKIFASDGTMIDEIPEIVAEFGILGPEYSYMTPDGVQDTAALIHGHFFDLDAFANEKDLSDEERELCAKKLLHACDKFPSEVWLHTKQPIAAPWPTFDTTPPAKVAAVAESVGLVAEALAYEKENQNREAVVKQLVKLLEQPAPAEDGEEVLTAA